MGKTEAFAKKYYPSEGYKELIQTVLKLLPEGQKGTFLMDSAYYKRKVVELLKEAEQDHSISVTHSA